MSVQPPTQERFDLNQAQLAGVVQRMWAAGPDILLRLLVNENNRLTLLLPGGALHGQPVTLMKGDRIAVRGYLKDAPYTESGRQFAEKSRDGEKLLKALPALAGIASERMATCLVVQDLAFETQTWNSAALEGVVSRFWTRQGQAFARLAIYDEHTSTTGKSGKDGRPWRQAHYVSVHFVDGLVAGRKVALKPKDRVRVSGRLNERRYSESVALFLMRTGQIGLLAQTDDADRLREIRTPRVATYVLADSIIQFTK